MHWQQKRQLALLARWIGGHGFDCNIDWTHGCVMVVIPATRYGLPVLPLIETVSTFSEARRALGY